MLHEVSRHFGRFAALRSITAEFARAHLHVVLGENGAGKSTLLRIIAGLIPPTRGTVAVLGSTVVSSVRERLAYMAHASMLYDELDAMENLGYFAGLYGIKDQQVCDGAIRTVGLDSTLKRRVGQYSQGMRQRLSLARAILHLPELLLLDEPFSNVDIGSARQMVQLLGNMRNEGRTIFVVTHQPALLESVADEFIWMAAGRIVARTRELEPPAQPGAPMPRPVPQEVAR